MIPESNIADSLISIKDTERSLENRIPSFRLRLSVSEGRDVGRKCEVNASHLSIGTSSDNDLRLRDRHISRRHCQIIARRGFFLLRDLSSRNGTFVNGIRIIETVIEPESIICIGSNKILFDPYRDWVSAPPSVQGEFGKLQANSHIMKNLFGLLEKIAKSPHSCLIVGEAGVGKALAAKSIHMKSERANGPFVSVDCSSMGTDLVSDILFGYEIGPTLRSDQDRASAFEEASGGTLLLDEISELPIDIQYRLLRVLQRQEVKRNGARKSTKIDVRVIATTRRDLTKMVEKGTFNKFLYYRLSDLMAYMPPLRERLDDITVLAKEFLQEKGTIAQGLTPDAIHYLSNRDWPDNVRELKEVLNVAAELCKTAVIDKYLLEDPKLSGTVTATMADDEINISNLAIGGELSIRDATEAFRRAYMQNIKKLYGNDLKKAAVHVGLLPKSIADLYRRYGLY